MNSTQAKVVVSSTNPVKVQAAAAGLRAMFPEIDFIMQPVQVPSGVADQPMSDQETLRGAMNRVKNALDAHPDADYWVGIEGGVALMDTELTAFAWVVVQTKEQKGKARSGTFFLPEAVRKLIDKGIELGTADDMVFGSKNSKQAGGAVGLLTGNTVTRQQLYEQAMILALIPFKNKTIYSPLE